MRADIPRLRNATRAPSIPTSPPPNTRPRLGIIGDITVTLAKTTSARQIRMLCHSRSERDFWCASFLPWRFSRSALFRQPRRPTTRTIRFACTSEVTYYECRCTSLAQRNESASGRAAQCEINPYDPPYPAPVGHHRHLHRDRAYEDHERGQIPVPAASVHLRHHSRLCQRLAIAKLAKARRPASSARRHGYLNHVRP